MIIYLVLLLPAGSSDLPEGRPGKPIAFLLVLLRMGFTEPRLLPAGRWSLTPPFHHYRLRGCIFLLHWPWSRLHRTLSGILPCEARTFLTGCPARSSVPLIFFHSYTLKHDPPTNSLTIELFGRFSLLTPRKYSRNFSSLFAS